MKFSEKSEEPVDVMLKREVLVKITSISEGRNGNVDITF